MHVKSKEKVILNSTYRPYLEFRTDPPQNEFRLASQNIT